MLRFESLYGGGVKQLKIGMTDSQFCLAVSYYEGFDEYTLLDYAHAFSTKIGDCYRSGIPFFAYGSKEIPCIQFGLDHNPDFSASSKGELKDKLVRVLSGGVTYRPELSFIRECFAAEAVSGRLRQTI